MRAQPIGVFDSGVGGLSVLRALQAQMPLESFVYVADSGHAPYGERDSEHVIRRSTTISDFLVREQGVKALVVACNTATAAAIHVLRPQFASIPVIGVEPALKPAVAQSRTGRIGVLATRSTLNSSKFQQLRATLDGQADFVLQPCDGLADAIEHFNTPAIEALSRKHIAALGGTGTAPGLIDTLVLGCTHYPFVEAVIAASCAPGVALLECGPPVARQTHRLLEMAGTLLAPGQTAAGINRYYSSGSPSELAAAVTRWLGISVDVQSLAGNAQAHG